LELWFLISWWEGLYSIILLTGQSSGFEYLRHQDSALLFWESC
jgi:hypothetical protein